MANNFLITGYWGEPHVTPENDRGINAAIFGTGRFVLPVGEQFKAEYIGNNTIRMYDGKLMDNGAAAGIPAGEFVDLLIANAGQGMKRNDIIVFQYSQDASTMVESGTFVVIKGTETSGTASDPALTQGDLLSGKAAFDQMAMWRVSVSGTTISAPVKLFSVYQNNVSHAANNKNPHGVTIDQIGAAPASHATNKSNPHGVTAAQVGAEPAVADSTYPDCYYRMVGNEKEWINPPMTTGTEYRTTERFLDSPVYTIILPVDVGYGTKDMSFTDAETAHMIRAAGGVFYNALNDPDFSIDFFANTMRCYGSNGGSSISGEIQIWFTK